MNRESRNQNNYKIYVIFAWCLFPSLVFTQNNDELLIEDIEIVEEVVQLCFGFSDIGDARALEICDALQLNENVKARELAENWIRVEPNSPAAQFALAEILLTVEGNLPRAQFHLNRAEELTNYKSIETAFNSGQMQWHYLTLSQLSYVHQLMGDQLASLEYLDKISEVYQLDIESSRGWPLIKLKQYDAAKESARRVLDSSDNPLERSRAWNTLCAAELASLEPIESTFACDRAIDEDGNISNAASDYDTVYLTNASEVSLSLLQMQQAEDYLDRATQFLNPDSVADPWVYKLFLTLNQGRFDDSRNALDRMLIWRQQQKPLVSVMNRAEHFLVSASFLMLAGYPEDAINLSQAALNQPDRNGSYSADDKQKDSFAALVNMIANRIEYQIQNEKLAGMSFIESIPSRLTMGRLKFNAWQAERKAASLFADSEVLQNRLRPYAPLDVHIPEWIEPEIVNIIGTGVISAILEQSLTNGAFSLNEGYYYAYVTEIAALDNEIDLTIEAAKQALALLPQEEVLLKARISVKLAQAYWASNNQEEALHHFETAYKQDPSVVRRLETTFPVVFVTDGTAFSQIVEGYLQKSPRFTEENNGFLLEIKTTPDLSICLRLQTREILSCYTLAAAENQSSEWNARELTNLFHNDTFGLGYQISKAQRSILLGSSVILSSQTNKAKRESQEAFLTR